MTPAEERMSLGSGDGEDADAAADADGVSLGSRSETFHTEGEIIEAEEVIEVGRVHEVRVSSPVPMPVERRAVSPVRMERPGSHVMLETGRDEHFEKNVVEGEVGEGSKDSAPRPTTEVKVE